MTRITFHFRIRKPSLARIHIPSYAKLQARFPFLKDIRVRIGTIAGAAIFVLAELITVIQPYLVPHSYALGAADSLLAPINQPMAQELQYNAAKEAFAFNSNPSATSSNSIIQSTGSQMTAVAYQNPSKGIVVTDPVNKIDFSLTPKFGLWQGRQDGNRVVYPLSNGNGWLVYTMHSIGTKEDILLNQSSGDTQSFEYTLGIGNGLDARVENDGSIGIYANTLLSGNVATSTAQDAALLQKARTNAAKNTLVFTIPAPTISGLAHTSSSAKASYALKGKTLTMTVTGLAHAKYPLTIDPSIYVVTAQQFMNGNNETNVDFDVADKLIEKGKTTGARFDAWNATRNLNTNIWQQGVAVAGGFIYTVGGNYPNGSSSIFNTQGASTYTVPAGMTSITVKMWGGGAGGGAGSGRTTGGAGGGAGYVSSTLSVTSGQTLNVYVGGGGAEGTRRTSGAGGGGGGTSGVRGSNGGGSGTSNGGGGGTQTAGGAGGTVPTGGNSGSNGTSLAGGDGADGRTGQGTDGSGAVGGLATGGGGGSSYTTGTSISNTAGSGTSPGNAGDADRNGAGDGGTGGNTGGAGGHGSNGLVLITAGSGSTNTSSVTWAQFNTSTGTIDSPNPGSGACSGWCTTSAYDLPAARSDLALVAYNGFLYAIGGEDSSCTAANGTGDAGICKTVYIAKLGANGEPRLWHPTDTNPNNWVYWYRDTDLTSPRSFAGAVAYNNRLYLLGGKTSSGGVTSIANTAEVADLTPTGTLGSWATSSSSLPYNLYGHGAQVYNDRLYIIGGASSIGGAPLSSVYYSKINSDGTLNNWVQTSSLTGGRMTEGGNFTASWGGYIYLSGGCSAVDSNGICTTVASDTQLASINADGSLDTWNTNASVSDARMGHNIVAWRNYIYEIGGCTSQSASNGACSSALNTINYGTINQDGDASTVSQSVPSGTTPCSGTTPYNCDLPPAGTGAGQIGQMLNSTAIMNGYLYVIGGCSSYTCTGTSGNTAYVAISSDGSLTMPTSCVGTYYGAWCVDSTHTIAGGVAAAATAVFGGRIYVIGGLTGSANKDTINYVSVNADGSLETAGWTSASLTGIGASNVSYEFAYSRANPSSASTIPGNLYIFGGCTASSSAGCTAYSPAVYKCNIATSGAVSACSTTNQLQIGTIPGDTQPGLGIMAGTVYADYIYLIGGVSPNQVDLKTTRYAEFDNNNNVVAVSGSSWIESPNLTAVGRRRGAAFGYNGYIYVVGGYDASSGVLADIEFAKVNVSDGSIGPFSTSAVTINQRWGLSVPVSNSYAYVIGGCDNGNSPTCNSGGLQPLVQAFQVYNNDSGAPAGFTASTGSYATDPDRIGASATVLNGYLYVAGGCTDMICSSVTSDVERAALSPDGTLGAWSNAGANLPAGRAFGQLKSAGGSLYYMGGKAASTCTPTGNSLFEKWNGISGTAVTDLYADPNYPNSPDITQTLNDGKLESPVNIDSNYGAKLSAILCPPTTGTYSFWVASDDNSELRLSTDANPANVTTIASVGGWTNQYEWTKYPSQHSANVTLTAGQPYYIEVNYKQGGGGDHAEIGWTLPSGTQQLPIPGSAYYSPAQGQSGPPSSNVYYTSPGNNGYQYRQPVTLNHSQVSGGANLTSFPVLVSLTENALKTVANGGDIQNSNGYDMLFTAGDGTTPLPYEVERYNGATGELVAWVNVPSVSYSADTPLYLYYDNSTINTFQGDVNGTWNSTYNSVLHLPNGSSLSTADSTVNNLSGTNNGATASTGIADGSASFNGSNQYISVPSATLPASNNFAVSLWFKTTTNGVLFSEQNQPVGSTPSSWDPMLYVDSTGKLHGGIYGGGIPNIVSSGTVNNGAWHNAVLAIDRTNSTQTLYLDGAQVGSVGNSPEGPFAYISIGAGYDNTWPNAPASPTSYFNGQIDEVQVFNTATVAPGWITTAYNSVNAPGSFETAGTRQSYGSYGNWYGGTGGSLTSWNTATNGLPQARANFGAAVWNNRLYVVGGNNASSSPQNTVYVSPQLNSGGNISSAWSTASTSFNVARSGLTVIAYANNLYVLGGFDGTNYLSDVQYAQINTGNGSVGNWNYTTSLPGPLSDSDGFAVNGYIYLMSGRSGPASCRPITLVAPISANTTIASGNNPTGVGEWYETNQKYAGDRYGASAVYNDGKAFVLGGGCTSMVGSSDRVYSTALLSQPQVAKYSIMIDTDSDVYPNKWLLNGIDNSIGAKWQLKYRSMTNTSTYCTTPAMTTWGQETNFGDVTLGTPGVYTPKDGSGANTNCARFFYFNVTVDSSQAFGYPDDVTRGPTITDLTLQFTADASKRLMHGRTFTGGLQQPDDTPYYTY